MKHASTAAVTLALVALVFAGAARANAGYNVNSQSAPSVTDAVPAALVRHRQTVGWHYEWRYHFNKFGEYVPDWIAVLNRSR